MDMKRALILSTAFLLFTFHFSLFTSQAQAQVKWHTIEEASAAKIGEKIYLVDFYTSWCGYCKKMDRETFSNPTVAKIINQYYYPVKFNAEGDNTFTWAGTTYRRSGRIHDFARGVKGYPTIVLFHPDGSMMQSIPGFASAEEYIVILWYFASGDYNRYPFDRYRQLFDTEIRPKMKKALSEN